MIYVFPCSTGECSIVYDETSLTDEDKARGIALTELPTPETPEGKMAVLMGNKSTNAVWWIYVDIPPDEISELKQQIADLQAQLGQATSNTPVDTRVLGLEDNDKIQDDTIGTILTDVIPSII